LALNMSAATAQVFEIIIMALALTQAGTKLVADPSSHAGIQGPGPRRPACPQ
jgi:hypothetical protein